MPEAALEISSKRGRSSKEQNNIIEIEVRKLKLMLSKGKITRVECLKLIAYTYIQ